MPQAHSASYVRANPACCTRLPSSHLAGRAVLAGVGHKGNDARAIRVGRAAALRRAEAMGRGPVSWRMSGQAMATFLEGMECLCTAAQHTTAAAHYRTSKPGRGSQRSSRQAPQPSSGWRVPLAERNDEGLTATAAQWGQSCWDSWP